MTSPRPSTDPLSTGAQLLVELSARFERAISEADVDGILEVLGVCRDAASLEQLVAPMLVAALRSADVSWVEIAKALALSRQAAWDRYRHAEATLGPTVPPALLAAATKRRSVGLRIGHVYTRVELRRLFDIRDATLNNGVFPMRTRNEIWLFVTENKQADRTQYQDELLGDDLRWEGQSAGRTDRLVADHIADNNDVVVFYRTSKTEHPGAGFRCEGSFVVDIVRSDLRTRPARFVLHRKG